MPLPFEGAFNGLMNYGKPKRQQGIGYGGFGGQLGQPQPYSGSVGSMNGSPHPQFQDVNFSGMNHLLSLYGHPFGDSQYGFGDPRNIRPY